MFTQDVWSIVVKLGLAADSAAQKYDSDSGKGSARTRQKKNRSFIKKQEQINAFREHKSLI